MRESRAHARCRDHCPRRPRRPGRRRARRARRPPAGPRRRGHGRGHAAAPRGRGQPELLLAPAASVVPIPDGASLVEAATLPMNGLTAMLGLDLLDLPSGSTLAVTGGAGLLAPYVIPLAKERGLHVLADAKPEDEALVRGFGADVVLPRGDGFAGAVRDAAPTAPTGSSTPRYSAATRSERSATAARWRSSAAGTTVPASAASTSAPCGCAPCSTAPTGSSTCATAPRRGGCGCASPASTRPSARPRRTRRWKRAACAGAP